MRLYELSEANVRFRARFAVQPNRVQSIFGAFDAIFDSWLSCARKSVVTKIILNKSITSLALHNVLSSSSLHVKCETQDESNPK